MITRRFQFFRQPFFWWVLFLVAIITVGIVAAFNVFTRGLGITNLSDLVPWGLWIAIDLSSIALSAGAFLLSAAVYLLGIKRLQPVARTAVFVGLIGYSMAVMTLLPECLFPEVSIIPKMEHWEMTFSSLYGLLAFERSFIYIPLEFQNPDSRFQI